MILTTKNSSKLNTNFEVNKEFIMAGHFRRQHRSMRGEIIDFSALSLQNQNQIALGNARMNAKGDILGEGGIVLKTQEQVEAEWAAARAMTQSFTTDIKSEEPLSRAAPPPMPTPRAAAIPDVEFPTIQDLVGTGVITPTPKRKIVDKDD
jgi:hypothetical protein